MEKRNLSSKEKQDLIDLAKELKSELIIKYRKLKIKKI